MDLEVGRYLKLRQAIHQEPELGYHEFETTKKLQEFFDRSGLQFCQFPDMTGGSVLIDAEKSKTVALRADIDALPLCEDTGAAFSSKVNGVMHACGHDMHTAIAAGIACELNRHRSELKCNVLVVFQPAEECSPRGGAQAVIETGVLQQNHVSEIYGLHMWPSLPVGDIELKPGAIMAASDRFRIEVQGKAAHAAEPHLGVDAISIAAQIDCALVHDLRREVDPFDPVSISIGSFQSNGRYNVICDNAVLEGTLRTTAEETRRRLHTRICEIAQGIAQVKGGRAQVKIDRGYSVVVNDASLFTKFSGFAAQHLGAPHVHTDIHSSLIAEDFCFYGTVCPALYLHVGCQSDYPLHSNRFLPNEGVLKTTVEWMVQYFLQLGES